MRTQDRVAEAKQRRRRIDRLYDHFDDVLPLITDPDLQDAILDWQDRADDAPGPSLLSHVQSRLAEFETEYEMYAKGVDGESNFPNACQDCEHYGVACPALTKRHEQTERERLEDDLQDASDDEVKRRLRRYGSRLGCVVIISLVDDWENEHEDLINDGQDFRRKTMHFLRPADDDSRADAEIGESVAESEGA